MARSHHRKQHKQHLRSYQHSKEMLSREGKTKVTSLFTILGLALGIGVAYFAVNTMAALVIGGLAGGIIGYAIGKKIDSGN